MSRPLASPKLLTGRRGAPHAGRFFGVVIAVNVIMAKLAIQTLPGTGGHSAYERQLPGLREWRRWPPRIRTRGTGRSTPISVLGRMAAPRCRSRRGQQWRADDRFEFSGGCFERPADRRADRSGYPR